MNKAVYSVTKRIIITTIAAVIFLLIYIFISINYLYGSDGHISEIDPEGERILKENLAAINALPDGSHLEKASYREGLRLGGGGLAGSFIDIYVIVPESSSAVIEYIGGSFPFKEGKHSKTAYAKITRDNKDTTEMMLHILLSDEDEAVHTWASKNFSFRTQDVANTLLIIAPLLILLFIWFPYEKIKKDVFTNIDVETLSEEKS